MTVHFWALVVALVSIGLWSILNFYVYYNLLLIWLAWRLRGGSIESPDAPDEWPGVTLQLPLYNEPDVVESLLDAAVRIDYPKDKLHIQVLDDSTDVTAPRAAARIARYQAQGFNIRHIQRVERVGYKAGALAHGLTLTDDDFVMILDADFVPQPSLLRDLIPHFSAPRVAMVQARWGHLHPPATPLQRTAAFWIERHFHIEQFARSRSGHFFHFNGSGGIWRREAIDDAGGWTADTLAEDLDLSLRAWQRDWQFVYTHDVVVPALLPQDVRSLKVQQARWARGAFQVARKHLPSLWRSSLRRRDVGFITLQLTGYSFPILLLFIALLAGPAAWARPHLGWFLRWCIDLPAIAFVLGLLAEMTFTAWHRGRRAAWVHAEASSLGLALAPLVLRAGLRGLRQMGGTFHRTPKQGVREGWQWDWGGAVELLLAAWCFAGATTAALLGGWALVPVPLFAGVGLAAFGVGTLTGARVPSARTDGVVGPGWA